jgi:hypothetical protein
LSPENVEGKKKEIKAELDKILLKADIVPTSKIRRRISRLVDALTVIEPVAPPAPPKVLTPAEQITSISSASSEKELEVALNNVVTPGAEDQEGVALLVATLDRRMKDTKLEIIGKLKRRIVRLLFVLNKSLPGYVAPVKTAAPKVAIKKPINTFVKPAIDAVSSEVFQKWCQDVEAASTTPELEEALTNINPDAAPDDAARAALTDVLTTSSKKDISSNSKIRRRVTRMITALEPRGEAESASAGASAAAAEAGGAEAMNVDTGAEGTDMDYTEFSAPVAPVVAPGAIPYVVFVGQLAFKVTVSGLEEHLRGGGVEGSIKVRLNTDAATGKSKGTAFVELEGPREMHKCIGMHHTLLMGRRINVEKTCGGRNKELRSQKIKVQRDAQKVKASEDVDVILKEYEEYTAIKIRDIDDSTMNRIYACSPSEARDVFEVVKKKLENAVSKSKGESYMLLKQALTDRDHGGSHVDQSRNLGYGSFKRGTLDAERPKKRGRFNDDTFE